MRERVKEKTTAADSPFSFLTTECPPGTFGMNCEGHCLHCNAQNSAAPCDRVTGECRCKAGWSSESLCSKRKSLYLQVKTAQRTEINNSTRAEGPMWN